VEENKKFVWGVRAEPVRSAQNVQHPEAFTIRNSK
jgi:hypothetical protein